MFKSVLKPIQVYFMVSRLQKMEKSNIFTKRTRHSSIFARIFIKLNFAIHIFKFTYKKSAFYNIFKLHLNTVQIFRRVIRLKQRGGGLCLSSFFLPTHFLYATTWYTIQWLVRFQWYPMLVDTTNVYLESKTLKVENFPDRFGYVIPAGAQLGGGKPPL